MKRPANAAGVVRAAILSQPSLICSLNASQIFPLLSKVGNLTRIHRFTRSEAPASLRACRRSSASKFTLSEAPASKSGKNFYRHVLTIFFVLIALLTPLHAQLQLTATVPSQGLSAANYYSPVELAFDRSLDTTSVSPVSIRINGKYQGRYGFTFEYVDSLNLLRLRPQPVFMVGEFITITLTTPGLQGTDGSSLSNPFQLSFRTGPVQGNLLAFPLPPFDIPLLDGDQQPAKIAIADFNKDAYPDVAVLNSSSNTLTILLDQVLTEGIAIPQAFQGHATGATPIDLSVADLDNDSNLDIAVVNFNEDNLLIFWGNGNGTFTAPTSITAGGRPSGVAAADYYDGDGLIDLAVSVFGEDKLQVYRNNGARSFTQIGRAHV